MTWETELAAEALREWIGDYGQSIPGIEPGTGNELVVRIVDAGVFALAALGDGWHLGTVTGVGEDPSGPIAALSDEPRDVLRRLYEQLGTEAATHRAAGRRKLAFTIGDFAAESASALQFGEVAESIQQRGLTSYR